MNYKYTENYQSKASPFYTKKTRQKGKHIIDTNQPKSEKEEKKSHYIHGLKLLHDRWHIISCDLAISMKEPLCLRKQ